MKRTDPQFKLRLPEELRERLERAAGEGGRSVTAEIVRRLETSFDEESEAGRLITAARDAMKLADGWRLLVERLEQALKERDEQMAANLQTVQEMTRQLETLGAAVERISK